MRRNGAEKRGDRRPLFLRNGFMKSCISRARCRQARGMPPPSARHVPVGGGPTPCLRGDGGWRAGGCYCAALEAPGRVAEDRAVFSEFPRVFPQKSGPWGGTKEARRSRICRGVEFWRADRGTNAAGSFRPARRRLQGVAKSRIGTRRACLWRARGVFPERGVAAVLQWTRNSSKKPYVRMVTGTKPVLAGPRTFRGKAKAGTAPRSEVVFRIRRPSIPDVPIQYVIQTELHAGLHPPAGPDAMTAAMRRDAPRHPGRSVTPLSAPADGRAARQSPARRRRCPPGGFVY